MDKLSKDQLSVFSGKEVVPKYADACGNTFLIYDLIENEPADWEKTKAEIWGKLKANLVDDALVLRKVKATEECLQVEMHVLEPDGTLADFCGNGARAVGTYLMSTYGKKYPSLELVSRRGNHPMKELNKTCFINMGQPIIERKPLIFNYQGKDYTFTLVDAVERHLVTKDFYDADQLTKIGEAINKELRHLFPQGINVNCMRVDSHTGELSVLTYERGVYRITQACGTGSTSCVAAAIEHGWIGLHPEYKVHVLGGVLEFFREEHKDRKGHDFWFGGKVQISKI